MVITVENKEKAIKFCEIQSWLLDLVERDAEENGMQEWKYILLCNLIGWSVDKRPKHHRGIAEDVVTEADGDEPARTFMDEVRRAITTNPIIAQQFARTVMKTPDLDKQVSVAEGLRSGTLVKCGRCFRNVKDLEAHQERKVCGTINNIAKTVVAQGTTSIVPTMTASDYSVGTIAQRRRKIQLRLHHLAETVKEEKLIQEREAAQE